MRKPVKSTETEDAPPLPPFSGERPPRDESCCKVSRVSRAYRLTGVDQELKRRYENGSTLHELAAYLNDRLTAVTLDEMEQPPETEPSTARAAIAGDTSVAAPTRDDIRATIAAEVDIDILQNSYVSHETVRRHLNEHLDVSTSKGGFDTFDEFEKALQNYHQQYENGVISALRRAGEKELIDGGQYRMFSTRIECQQCSETYRLRELLENRGCSCSAESE